MTYGVTLASWEQEKIIRRELELYRRYQQAGFRVVFLTYGGKLDILVGQDYGLDVVLVNKWRLPLIIYSWLIPIIYRSELNKAKLLKTNQMRGSHVARRCAKKFQKPLIIRQGFSYFEFVENEPRVRWLSPYFAKKYELRNLSAATALVCTTPRMVTDLKARYPQLSARIFVVPNYVLPEVWSPPYRLRCPQEKYVFGYVGRLVPQKNLTALVNAAVGLPVTFVFVGSGREKQTLETLAKVHKVSYEILERSEQQVIVEVLRRCDAFVLCSKYEGHPKVLIEAMTLGIPILGVESPGIMDEIEDDVTGLLVQPTISGLRSGIINMISMSNEKKIQLGDSARRKATECYSLTKVFEKEKKVVEFALEKQNRS